MTDLYAATSNGLLILRRRGGQWHAEQHLEGLAAQCLAVDPLRPERVYCGTFGHGLRCSQDAGASWQPAGEGIASPQVTAVAVSRNERAGALGVVYAGTEPSALYRSEDGGANWEELPTLLALPSAPTWSFPPRPYTSHVRAIALDLNRPGHLYVAIEAGALVRSYDAGRTWEDRRTDGPFDSHTLAMPQQAQGRIYSAAGDGYMRPGNGFAESQDAGDSWQRPGTGLRQHYLWGLAVDPANADTLVVSAAPGPQQAHNPSSAESTIYRRTAGQAWEPAHAGLPASRGLLASVLAANPAELGVFYAGNNQGLYRSSDVGLTWEPLEHMWPAGLQGQRVHDLVVAQTN